MRLICPECAAQYEIADGLVPPEGRDVECSACGHGWRQPGEGTLVLTAEAAVEDDLDPGDDSAPGGTGLPPSASRRLAEPVFSILREEAERELAARAAEREALSDTAATGTDSAWRGQAAGDADALPDPHALAASLEWEVPARPAAEAPAPAPAPALPAPAAPRQPAVTEASAAAMRQRRARDRGFAAGILLAALLVAAYAAAPSLAGRGAAGAQVMQARAAADEGRVWLQMRAEALTDRAIAGARGLLD